MDYRLIELVYWHIHSVSYC